MPCVFPGNRNHFGAFGSRFIGSGPFAELLDQRFKMAVKRLGLNQRGDLSRLDTTLFKRPVRPGDQLALF